MSRRRRWCCFCSWYLWSSLALVAASVVARVVPTGCAFVTSSAHIFADVVVAATAVVAVAAAVVFAAAACADDAVAVIVASVVASVVAAPTAAVAAAAAAVLALPLASVPALAICCSTIGFFFRFSGFSGKCSINLFFFLVFRRLSLSTSNC